MSDTTYYRSHATESLYNTAFAKAREWALTHPKEQLSHIARQFDIKYNNLRKSVYRAKKKRAIGGLRKPDLPGSGGHNKLLSEAQEEAILQYCEDHWDLGLGATHAMVKAAITHKVRSVYKYSVAVVVAARRRNKEKKVQVEAYKKRGEEAPEDLLIPDREPDKNPTPVESALLTEEGHPELLQAVRECENSLETGQEVDSDVDILCEYTKPEAVEATQYIESSPPPQKQPEYVDSSDESGVYDITAGNDYVYLGV